MIYDVYELGEDWRQPDLIKVLQRGPTAADLRITRRFPNSNSDQREARFYRPGTKEQILRVVLYVDVIAIGADGLLLVGTVTSAERNTPKSRLNSFKVGYLCKTPGAPAVVRHKHMVKNQVQRQGRAPSGFNPEDDDFVEPTYYGPLDPFVST